MQDAINAAVIEHSEVPSELYARVAEYHHLLRRVHVEAKVEGNRWVSTRQQLVWEGDCPHSPDEVANWLCEMAGSYAERESYDKYRAVLWVHDKTSDTLKRKYCLLTALISPGGDMQIADDGNEQFTERDHMELLHGILDKQQNQIDNLHQQTMDLHGILKETVTELSGTMVSQAQSHAAGIATIGENMGGVVDAATNALKAAAELHNAKQEEATVVQLAKIDQDGKKHQTQFAMGLLNKVAGPLVKQLSSVFQDGDKKQTKALPNKSTTATNEAKDAGPEESPASSSTADPSSNETATAEAMPSPDAPARDTLAQSLESWRSKLTDEHRGQLRVMVGENHYIELNEAKTNEEAYQAICGFVKDFKQQEDEDPEEAFTKLWGITQLLGEELANEFGILLLVYPD